VRLYNRLVALAARRCAVIMADSEASRRDILRVLDVPPKRVRVVYLAADARFQPCTDPRALARVRARYGLPARYIFYLGGLDERKNVPGLLRAYARLPVSLRREQQLCLAIAGQARRADPRRFPPLEPEIERLGIGAEVRLLGHLSEADKPLVYSGAALFAFPSLYEGFGLDPLEAMACGTPVVCSNRTSLPEVVGPGGLLVDPMDEQAFAAAIEQVLRSPGLAADLVVRGREQAARFRWDDTARRVAALYRALAQ
jgi:glycosyltransferase involved in cell wall biosynthesis